MDEHNGRWIGRRGGLRDLVRATPNELEDRLSESRKQLQSQMRDAPVYNFSRPMRFGPTIERNLNQLFTNFSYGAANTLSNYMQQKCEVTMFEIGQKPWNEYMDEAPASAVFCALDVSPLPVPWLFQVSLKAALAAIERQLGGTGSFSARDRRGRGLTIIEERLLSQVFNRLFADLNPLLVDIITFAPECPRIKQIALEMQSLEVAHGSETVLVVEFWMKLAENGDHAKLVIPYRSLEPITEKLEKELTERETPSITTESVETMLRSVPLPLTVQIGKTTIALRDLMDLSPGDVVLLDTEVGVPVPIYLANMAKFTGQFGKRNGRYAVRLLDGDLPADQPINRRSRR